jgi:hypothetical protein
MPLIKLKSSSINNSVDLRGVPTASQLSNIATTQMVQQAISEVVGTAPQMLDTLGKLAQSLSTDSNKAN